MKLAEPSMDGTRRGISELRALGKDGFVPGPWPRVGISNAETQDVQVRTDGHPATERWKDWPRNEECATTAGVWQPGAFVGAMSTRESRRKE